MKQYNKHILLNNIKDAIKQLDSEAEIILFGSRARGDSGKESDWDILVLLSRENKDIKRKVRDIIFEIELETEQPISTLIYTKTYWDDLVITPLYQNIKLDGVLL